MLTIPTLRRSGTTPVRRGTAPSDPAAAEGDRPRSLPRRIASLALWLVVGAAVVLLWPAWLGGSTRLTIVGGTSMEPTYLLGDLLVVREGGSNDVGDIVVFRVPEGPGTGTLVVHRIVERRTDGGIVTKGDNRERPDEWPLTDDDVVGHPVVHVPYAGRAVWALRTPWSLAVLGGLAFMILFWPRTRDDEPDERSAERRLQAAIDDAADAAVEQQLAELLDELAATSVEDTAPLPRVVPLPTASAITPTLMAEAEAWLDEQLAQLDAPLTVGA